MKLAPALAVIVAVTAPAGALTANRKPGIAVVVIDKLAFGSVPSGLRVGDSVLWVNQDLFRHSATAAGHFDVDLPAGGRRQMLLTRPGAFVFKCKYHPGMKGLLKVVK